MELQNGKIVETEVYNSGEQMLEEYASYVVDGGAASHVRDELGNGWHIDAKRKCISHGVQWFEV